MSSVLGSIRVAVPVAAFTFWTAAVFGQASFQGVGDLPGGEFNSMPYGVSAGGSVVVGRGMSEEGAKAFRWQGGTLTPMAPVGVSSYAWGVSADGSVVVGYYNQTSGGGMGFRWEASSVTPLLGPGSEDFLSAARDISADGLVIVGSRNYPLGNEVAAVWSNGLVTYPADASSGLNFIEALGISGDGLVVVGLCRSTQGNEACLWQDEQLTGLGCPQGISCWGGECSDASADGSVVVGFTHMSPNGSMRAFRWEKGAMVALGDSPEGAIDVSSMAYGVSGDGTVVVGVARFVETEDEAFIWDGARGMRSLRDALVADHGLDLAGWMLEGAHAISSDGMAIVGYGKNPQGHREAWLAEVPPPPTIISSDPPDGIIDARQDYSVTGQRRMGIDRVRLVFSTVVRHAVTGGALDETSFQVLSTDGHPPSILAVNLVEGTPTTYDLVFPDPITPGAWTTIIADVARIDGRPDEDLNDRVTIGFLPADADGSGKSTAVDILHLIDHLNGVYDPPMEIWQCDINRSGVCNAADILRLVDMLNGAASSRPWLGVSLPPQP